MHIPDQMLDGTVCSAGMLLAAAGIAVAARAAIRSRNRPPVLRFAAVAALVFAGQMVNFPVQDGTSGHLLGGVLASALLGVPFGVLALALVVTMQALVFADGGVLVLGANVFNMALLGAGLGGLLQRFLSRRGLPSKLAVPVAAWISVLLAASACAVELAAGGTAAIGKILPAMLGVHALIGAGEAVITLCLLRILEQPLVLRRQALVPFLAALLAAALLSPWASSHPDGLERVALQYGFLPEATEPSLAPLAGYAIPIVENPALSTALAGLAGLLLVGLAGMLAGRVLARQ